jgi:hypothetical protein
MRLASCVLTSIPVTDVALSIMALMAGGLVVELFASSFASVSETPVLDLELPVGQLCEEAGNPS